MQTKGRGQDSLVPKVSRQDLEVPSQVSWKSTWLLGSQGPGSRRGWLPPGPLPGAAHLLLLGDRPSPGSRVKTQAQLSPGGHCQPRPILQGGVCPGRDRGKPLSSCPLSSCHLPLDSTRAYPSLPLTRPSRSWAGSQSKQQALNT